MERMILFIFCIWILAGTGCKPAPEPKAEEEEAAHPPGTPVTVTEVMEGELVQAVQLNAVSAFLLKTTVKANATGYLQVVRPKLGDYVTRGQELFVLKTKEAESLGNTLKILDSSLHFEGVIHIKAPGSGYITQLTYQAGNYVQDGEQLATISDNRSFVFLLELPYELKPYLAQNKTLLLRLPDSTQLEGTIQSALPLVDPASQTQRYEIKINTSKQIPENLVAKLNLVKSIRAKTIYLPKAAVLSDEVQQSFWIMKMLDSVTAIKVPVQKGMETGDRVEILSPKLVPGEKVVLSGNYGLADTARVSIMP